MEINANDIVVDGGVEAAYLDIDILNRGHELLTSRRKYPIFVSYHITDKDGTMLIYDGERTPITDFVRKGSKRAITMKINLPDILKEGNVYHVDITLVAEGCFWLDRDGKNRKKISMTIS